MKKKNKQEVFAVIAIKTTGGVDEGKQYYARDGKHGVIEILDNTNTWKWYHAGDFERRKT